MLRRGSVIPSSGSMWYVLPEERKQGSEVAFECF